jgi:hypothetical protein
MMESGKQIKLTAMAPISMQMVHATLEIGERTNSMDKE